ncbi:hypothetical protein WJX73_003300 [Symbiochloris irregularis]|uniref:Uncharacterized protein n=1 Tax=Symbiochloris irregularis TaxID=706552 RepID=A0AAW1PVR1_9CHLO
MRGTFFRQCDEMVAQDSIRTLVTTGELFEDARPEWAMADAYAVGPSGNPIAVMKAKHRGRRPAPQGFQLIDQWGLADADHLADDRPSDLSHSEDPGRACLQINEITAEMHAAQLPYGVLFTDEAFWLFQYQDDDSVPIDPGKGSGGLQISDTIYVNNPEQSPLAVMARVRREEAAPASLEQNRSAADQQQLDPSLGQRALSRRASAEGGRHKRNRATAVSSRSRTPLESCKALWHFLPKPHTLPQRATLSSVQAALNSHALWGLHGTAGALLVWADEVNEDGADGV